jgi:hypothetical protein
MKAFTQEMVRCGILLFVALWILVDWVTVGSNVGGWQTKNGIADVWVGESVLPWAADWTRILLLALVTAFCGLAASEARPTYGSQANRLITYAGAMLMAGCCAYTIWRTYMMSTFHGDSLYLAGGLVLQVAVFYLTLRLKQYKMIMNA